MNEEKWSCSVCSRGNERVHPLFCKGCHNMNKLEKPKKKDKWFIHTESEIEGRQNYTITTNPEISGWNTDSGYESYGLPKEVASFIVEVLNFLNATSMWENTKFGWQLKEEFRQENSEKEERYLPENHIERTSKLLMEYRDFINNHVHVRRSPEYIKEITRNFILRYCVVAKQLNWKNELE